MPRRFTSRSADTYGLPTRTESADEWFASWSRALLADLRRASPALVGGVERVAGKQKTAGSGFPAAFTTPNPVGGPRGCEA